MLVLCGCKKDIVALVYGIRLSERPNYTGTTGSIQHIDTVVHRGHLQSFTTHFLRWFGEIPCTTKKLIWQFDKVN